MDIAAEDDAPILLLEDDVEFTPELFMRASDIESFVISGRTEAYNLGCIPFFTLPTMGKHVRCMLSGMAQAVIYTRAARLKMRHLHIQWVHDLELSKRLVTHIPSRPCAVQKMMPTSNSNGWGKQSIVDPRPYFYMFGSKTDGQPLMEYHHALARVGGCGFVYTVVVILITTAILKKVHHKLYA